MNIPCNTLTHRGNPPQPMWAVFSRACREIGNHVYTYDEDGDECEPDPCLWEVQLANLVNGGGRHV